MIKKNIEHRQKAKKTHNTIRKTNKKIKKTQRNNLLNYPDLDNLFSVFCWFLEIGQFIFTGVFPLEKLK
jgi:hypothetical protein